VASPELAWAIETVGRNRAAAGVTPDRYDVRAARASLPPSDLPLPEGTQIIECEVAGVACYWVQAPGADDDVRILYLHGGGYCAGSFGSHRSLVGWLSHSARSAILFPEYRLAPEHKFPAALNDASACLGEVWHLGPRGKEAARAVIIGGDSAGGGLSIASMLRARDAGEPLPDGAFVLCGMLDLDEQSSPFLMSSPRTRDMVRLIVDDSRDLHNPLLSVVLADLRGLPPLLVQTGSADYCMSDCERFAAAAIAAGVDTTLEVWPEMIHVWQRFAPKLPEAMDSIQQLAEFIGRRTATRISARRAS
jgi:monoterpene epsilon-lactone hydrolase